MKQTINFNQNWTYSDLDCGCPWEIDYVPVNWKPVSLPHDYGVTKDFRKDGIARERCGFLACSVLYYRKYFSLTEKDLRQHISLEFKSVFMDSTVWVNGKQAAVHPYGYIGFACEISPFLHPGLNLICVRADCGKYPQSRWYNGCGIYQDVELVLRDEISVARHGSYITTTDETETGAKLHYELRIENRKDSCEQIRLESFVADGENQIVSLKTLNTELQPGENVLTEDCSLTGIKRWSPEEPKCYRMVSRLYQEDKLLEQYETSFGIRKLDFIPGKGFFLNDRSYKMKGVCLHHDGGVAGAVFQTSVWKKRLKLLKKMGCNAIRTTHNPFDEKFYDLCDTLGFFVMDEFTDIWDEAKTEYDYSRYFTEWWKTDAEEFICRDRNHPSVVIWSIGNEIRGITPEKTKMLQDFFHQLDPSRPVTCGVCNVLDFQNASRAVLDIAGYNDGGGACFRYEQDHESRPDQLMVATESPHTLHTRGFYRTQTWWRDHNQPRIDIPDLSPKEIFTGGSPYYRSSYDNAGVRTNIRDTWKMTAGLDYLIGEFRWTGVDYYGEGAHWPLRKMDCGVIDSANFVKDPYYLYQSLWTDAAEAPMIHLLPHWTHPNLKPDTLVPVIAYTNCDEAELFFNGKSLGMKPMTDELQIQWDVPYRPGELKAVAYRNGKEAACDLVRTAGRPARLSLSCDDMADASFNGIDTIQTDCAVTDREGNFVPSGCNKIYFSNLRSCEWVGSENGDSIDLTALYAAERRAFYGLAAGTVRLPKGEQPVGLTVSAILGDRYFAENTTVSIDTADFDLWQEKRKAYQIRYTLDGSMPDERAFLYVKPLELSETTVVTASVYDGPKLLVTMQELFIKGKEPDVPAFPKNNVLTFRPEPTPCAELQDDFAADNFRYRFAENGEWHRILNHSRSQLLGYWQYDSGTGQGKVYFLSGEVEPFAFRNEEKKDLLLDNRNGGFFAFSNEDTLCFTRVALSQKAD